MTRGESFIAVASVTWAWSSVAFAEDCSFLRIDPLLLTDRQIYVETVAGAPWQLLSQPPANAANGDIKLAYVFRESFRQARSGVVVVKSGRNRSFTEPQRNVRDKDVALFRGPGSYCRGLLSFEGRVSAKSYDDYHDLGQGGDEIATIKAFHSGYVGRNKYCRDTDENVADARGPRNNLGQFSYDTNVVNVGTYSQVATNFGITTALASSEKYEDQRVEIKMYETKPGMPTCVRITLPAQKKPSSFVRINDLEGLTFDKRQGAYIRSIETEWKLTPTAP